jgi:hypothetical protein
MSMSKYIEAPEEFDGQGQGRMPAVGSGWVGCDLLQALTRLASFRCETQKP